MWFGSCLSALWILIANSWMQTPAGAELAADGSRAVITDFLAAAFNPSTLPRYGHTVTALLVMGAFVAMAIGGYYLLKKRHQDFAMKAVKIGSIVGIVATCGLLFFAHSSAVEVAEEQPTKLAMMEGMYDSEVPPLYAFGWVDEESQEVLSPIAIPGGTSFLATGTWDTEYMGLNELAETEQYADLSVEDLPVNLVFQSYHLMVMLFGLILITVVLALIFQRGGKLKDKRWLQRLLFVSPLFPFFAIVTGWVTAEIGRQPWVVYPSTSGPEGVSLLTSDAISQSVSSVEVLVTIVLFTLIYLFIFVAYVRIVAHFIKKGPDDGEAVAPAADAKATSGAAAVAAAGAAKDGE